MAQILGPDFLSDLVIASTTTITMQPTYQGKAVRVTIGGAQFTTSTAITLNLATTGFNGLASGTLVANQLFFIYAVQQANVLGLVASTSGPSTGPTGFTAWKEVGRFRTLFATATVAQVVSRNTSQTRDVDYTPIYGGVTVSQSALSARIVRDKVHISGRFSLSSSLGSLASVSIPSLLTTRPGALGGNGFFAGKWVRNNGSAGSIKQGVVSLFPGDISFAFSIDDTSNATNPFVNQNSNSIFGPTDTVAIQGELIIPVYELVGLFD